MLQSVGEITGQVFRDTQPELSRQNGVLDVTLKHSHIQGHGTRSPSSATPLRRAEPCRSTSDQHRRAGRRETGGGRWPCGGRANCCEALSERWWTPAGRLVSGDSLVPSLARVICRWQPGWWHLLYTVVVIKKGPGPVGTHTASRVLTILIAFSSNAGLQSAGLR